MKHGSLFSGGGGFDLAAQMAGFTNVFHCEKDPFCQRILKYYWPHADSHPDIKEFNAHEYAGQIDILTGGFPCQPFSTAGKRRGTADDRYLWPEMLRIADEIKPRWIVGENVSGLINWNDGLVFGQVLSDLEGQGFEVWPVVLPACGINAPHQRYRVWFIALNASRKLAGFHTASSPQACADTHRDRCDGFHRAGQKHANQGGTHAQHDAGALDIAVADTDCKRLERGAVAGNASESWQARFQQLAGLCPLGDWHGWPTQSPVCGGDDGLPRELDGITFPKWRMNAIRMYGNAIVPQLAYRIFTSIKDFETQLSELKTA